MRVIAIGIGVAIGVIASAGCAPRPAPTAVAPAPAPASPATDAADPLIAQLEAQLRAEPDNHAVVYALAMINDRSRRVDDALTWLERLAMTPWENGLDPADFRHSSAGDAARFDTARAAIEKRWKPVPTAHERLRSGERDLLPEGMERHPLGGELLLSSGRKRKVVALAPDGTARDVVGPAQDGLLATLGLRVDPARGTLWVASAAAPFMERATDAPAGTSRLHAFDLATGALRARFELPASSLLNDVAVLPDGRAVVTDSAGSMVWITGEGHLEPLLPADAVIYPNGIVTAAIDGLVYVASWRGIVVVDWRARTAAPLRLPAGTTSLAGIDGLYLHRGALLGIQNAVGRPRVVRVPLTADGRSAVRVDVLETGSPIVDNPTTGVVIGDELIFLARRNRETAFAEGAPSPPPLEDLVIAAVPLPTS